jgi:hypothetical protein
MVFASAGMVVKFNVSKKLEHEIGSESYFISQREQVVG